MHLYVSVSAVGYQAVVGEASTSAVGTLNVQLQLSEMVDIDVANTRNEPVAVAARQQRETAKQQPLN